MITKMPIINCLGASNTRMLIDNEGVRTKEINYPVMLGLRLRCTTRNYGKNGSSIALQPGREDSYYERARGMEKDADIIIFQGGGNDCNHGVPLGELGSTDPYTYCGAIRLLIRMIRSEYPGAQLIVSTAMQKKNEPRKRTDGLKHIDFYNAFVSVCRSEGIEPIDFMNDPLLDPFDPESLPDGEHMSERACMHMADVFAEYIQRM